MHIGFEIEGSRGHLNLKTLFLTTTDIRKITFPQYDALFKKYDIEHIYFGCDRDRIDIFEVERIASIIRWYDDLVKNADMFFTIEIFLGENEDIIQVMKNDYPNEWEILHAIVCIPDNKDFKVLRIMKDSDNIKLQEDSEGRLWCFEKKDAVSVTDFPFDYQNDSNIDEVVL